MAKHNLILLTGSNQEQPEKQIGLAKGLIEKRIGVVKRASHLYKTAAWGNEDQAPFVNQALHVETLLPPMLCLKKCLEIELNMGRKRMVKWEARIIDIDIMFYGNQCITRDQLVVPHPHMQDRNFALVCLKDIIPSFVHPVLKKSINTLFLECSDTLEVVKL